MMQLHLVVLEEVLVGSSDERSWPLPVQPHSSDHHSSAEPPALDHPALEDAASAAADSLDSTTWTLQPQPRLQLRQHTRDLVADAAARVTEAANECVRLDPSSAVPRLELDSYALTLAALGDIPLQLERLRAALARERARAAALDDALRPYLALEREIALQAIASQLPFVDPHQPILFDVIPEQGVVMRAEAAGVYPDHSEVERSGYGQSDRDIPTSATAGSAWSASSARSEGLVGVGVTGTGRVEDAAAFADDLDVEDAGRDLDAVASGEIELTEELSGLVPIEERLDDELAKLQSTELSSPELDDAAALAVAEAVVHVEDPSRRAAAYHPHDTVPEIEEPGPVEPLAPTAERLDDELAQLSTTELSSTELDGAAALLIVETVVAAGLDDLPSQPLDPTEAAPATQAPEDDAV